MKFKIKPEYKWILLSAAVIRIIAVIFSQGYGMHDDHFLVIESAASWANQYDYNNWLPWSEGNMGHPEGHSFTYVGLNYIYFSIMKLIGVSDPKLLMLLNRLIHAIVSMIVVIYGMKITEKLSNVKNARIVGWLLALLWIIPFISVRNLVETAPIPIMVYGFWVLIRERKLSDFLIGGMLFGLAVSFRYQIGVFAIGIAAIYFFRFQWKIFLIFCAGVVVTFIITQGLVDYLIWGYPFAEMIAYIIYNMNEGTGYLPNTNYFMYLFVLVGSLLVPFGLLIFAGFLKSWKKYALLFIPTVIFILFHTFYPNRQERFILTVLPFFIMLGVMGWELFKETNFKTKFWRIAWVSFWVLNIPMLFLASTTYSKKSRVEAMYSIYGNKIKNDRILSEGSGSNRTSMLPKFYGGEWHCSFVDYTNPSFPASIEENGHFDYIFFFDEIKLEERIRAYRKIYPDMTLEKKCDPNLVDILIRKMNPRNANEYIEVWKTNDPE